MIKKHFDCLKFNKKIVNEGLAPFNFGNVSIRINKNKFLIKPSGCNLNKASPTDMVEVSIKDVKYRGGLNPSVDTPTHAEIYKNFINVNAVMHVHSEFLTIWSQAKKEIPIFGTTHADFSNSSIPVTKEIKSKIKLENYELETGKNIIATFKKKKLNPDTCPAILVANHGAFIWGKNLEDTFNNVLMLEFIAKLAYGTYVLNKNIKTIPKNLINKHFTRKNGSKSYYGQKK